MNITGRTPLFRARKIEALLGVKKIYLKLEGANPYGHKYDRLSEYLVKDAIFKNRLGILAEGPTPYIQSVIHFGNDKGIEVTVPINKGESEKYKLNGEFKRLEIKSNLNTDYRHLIDNYCRTNKLYNAYNGYANINTSILALEEIGDELFDKFGESIDTIFLQLSYGIGLQGIHNSFERRYIKGISQKTPSLISCTIPKGNVIYEQYKKTFELPQVEENVDLSIKYSKYLRTGNGELLESSLDAVYDTRGTMLGISEDALKECAKDLHVKEGVSASVHEVFSLAGLYQMARAGKLKEGIHIVVLNDGKSKLQIEHIKKEQYTRDELYSFVDSFLKEYSDSYEEIVDAIANAHEKGTILLAKRNGTVQGIAVVVHMGFQDFIPTYHLGYIGTAAGNEGRGIATGLLEEVINFTGGNVSLHVDADNNRASRVYSKMGFKHCYNRMIYKNK